MSTLVFCTSFSNNPQHWQQRYRKWVDYFASSSLEFDQILMVDDGSPVLPEWSDFEVLTELPAQRPSAKKVLFHFTNNLGRQGIFHYPGWFRSFGFAAQYAKAHQFIKVVHIESDAYLMSSRMVDFVNDCQTGWTTFWCPRWQCEESAIQVICRDHLEVFLNIAQQDYDAVYAGKFLDKMLPYTSVRKDFVGDRYAEGNGSIPVNVDYVCQFPMELKIDALVNDIKQQRSLSAPDKTSQADVGRLFEQGLALHKQGQLVRAKMLYEAVLKKNPKHFDALNALGAAEINFENYREAVNLISSALLQNNKSAEAYYNLGLGLDGLNLKAQAIEAYDECLKLDPKNFSALNNKSKTQRDIGKYEEAIVSSDAAIAIKSDHAVAYLNRAIAFMELKQFEAAIASFDQAIGIKPGNAEAYFNRGNAQMELKQFEAALASYDRAINTKPDYADAYFKKGLTLQELKQLPTAVASYDKAISVKPDFANAYLNRGSVLLTLKQLDAALDSYNKAIRIKPDFVQAYSNRAVVLKDLGQIEAALASYDEAISINPDYAGAYWNKSFTLLLSGRFEEGWKLYEWRWKHEDLGLKLPNFSQPLWLGVESLQGQTILLHSEQGLGDTIQFCRYAKLVKALGAHVVMGVPAALVPLLHSLEGVDELVKSRQALPAFDYHCPLLSLPLAFKTELSTIPSPEPYLRSDKAMVKQWRAKLGRKTKPRIGLVWSGSTGHTNDHNRSLKLEELLPYLPEGFEYVCLQKEIREIDQETLNQSNIQYFGDELKDFADTAALCELMDVVISVDTSVAHLSGALGKPTWVLLSYSPDWRWLLDREDSPWYGSVKLYRQEVDRSWASVLKRVSVALLSQTKQTANLALAMQTIDQSDEALISYEKATALDSNNHEIYLNKGIILRRQKRFDEAMESITKAIELKSDCAEAYFNRGFVFKQQFHYEAALSSYDKAISLKPDYVDALINKGNTLQALKQFEAAIASYDRAISIQPDYAEAHCNLANALTELKQFEAALASYDRAINLKPDYAEAYSNRGYAQTELKQFEVALASYDKAISIKSDYAEAYFNRGVALQALKQLDAALASYDKAISIKPGYAEVYFNRGCAQAEFKQFKAALTSYDKAISIKPDYVDALINKGNTLQALKQFETAIASYDLAISIQPDYAAAHSNLANALTQLKQFDAALASYDKAISIKPDNSEAYWNKSLACLLIGEFEEGWKLYEWRWKHEGLGLKLPNFSQPQWLGVESLQGQTILLHSEQGLGDTIQFCRYAKLVKALGAHVVMESPAALVPLLQGLEGVDELVESGQALPAFDYHCPLLSLPLAFKTELSTIPSPEPYLSSDKAKVKRWRAKLGRKTKPRIGLVWSGSTVHKNDRNRSLTLDELTPYLPEGFAYVCLQNEIREVDQVTLQQSSIQYFGDELKDFADTAALCELMDVVISVDTSVAHLSGALGKPTWVLLPYSPDWRWLLDREDSPWYGSVKLYRQEADRTWSSVLKRVENALLQEVTLIESCAVYTIQEPQRLVVEASSSLQVETEIAKQFERGLALHQKGELVQAKMMYESVLKVSPRHFDALHLLGAIAGQSGEFELAVDLISQALEINPNHAATYSNLANAHKELKDFEAALFNYDRAISLDPSYTDAYLNQASTLYELKRFDAALKSYEKLIGMNPRNANLYYIRGNIHKELNQWDAALTGYSKAISLNSNYVEAYINRGNIHKEINQLDEALVNYDKAIDIKPDDPDVYSNRGVVLNELKQFEAALASYDKAISIKPDYAEAYSNRGITLKKLKQFEAALASYDKAISIKPDYAEAYCNRGVVLNELKQFEAALASYDKAISLEPSYASAYSNRGVTLYEIKEFEAALASYDKAISIKPDYAEAYWNKSLACLLVGQFEEGWKLYEWRWRHEDLRLKLPNFSQPLWLGVESLKDQTILLHSEQGLGDAIQFCRYAKLVKSLGARVVMGVLPALVPLLQSLEGVDELITDGQALPAFDYQCTLLSLPLAFKTELSTIPSPEAYLRSDKAKVKQWETKLGLKTKPCVGLVWSGSTSHKNDQNRSLTLNELIAYLPDGFEYVCLQKEIRDIDQQTLRQSSIQYFGDELKDFADTAALCELMDVVISVDTSVAHLSGALGKPTWVLLPYVPDWRWLLDRQDSPWYDSVKLYRQGADRDWSTVLQEVGSALLQDEVLSQNFDVDTTQQHQRLVVVQPNLILRTETEVAKQFEQGLVLHQQGQLAQAKVLYEAVLKANPKHLDALHMLGVIALMSNYVELAVSLIGKFLQQNKSSPDAYFNHGLAAQANAQPLLAIESYDKAISLNSCDEKLYWNKSLSLLLAGRFDEGWRLYEYGWRGNQQRGLRRISPQPLWLGVESLKGETILLHSEQGLGDTIQFCRYAKLVKALGARVVMRVPAALVPLLQSLEGVDELITEGQALPAFDYHCPLLSLPLAFKTELSTIPSPEAYLRSDKAKVKQWETKLGLKTKPCVGLVWSGSTSHKNDQNRSLTLNELIAYLPAGFAYVCLQKEIREVDQETLNQSSIQYFGDELRDFADTAALCELMDVAISVDTSVAHLSGALGKPTWVLLPHVPDWRWLLDREDSPWYDSVKLYRQDADRSWSSVLKRVANDLLRLS